jgi:hypothetical protein
MNVQLLKLKSEHGYPGPYLKVTLRVRRPRGKKHWDVRWHEGYHILYNDHGLRVDERADVIRQARQILQDPIVQTQLTPIRTQLADMKRQHDENTLQQYAAAKPVRDAEHVKNFQDEIKYLTQEMGASLEDMHRWLDEVVAELVMGS